MKNTSYNKKKYFIIIVDDYSRAVWVEPLANKFEAVPKIKDYIQQLEMVYDIKVQGIMADNGTEFVNSLFKSFLSSKGIKLFTSVPYMPQQNRVAERAIRTIVEGARSMIYAAKLPLFLWSIAVKTMMYLKNRSPTRANDGQTPIEQVTGEKPDLSHLRIFGQKLHFQKMPLIKSKKFFS